MATVTPSNLLHGAGTLYHGAYGAAEPAQTENALNTAPASAAWTNMGATDGGLTVAVAQEYVELRVDQVPEVVERRLTTRDYSVTTSLAEGTFTNLNLILNNATTTASSTGIDTLTPDSSTAASQPDYFAILVDGHAPNQKKGRVILRKCLNTSGFETAYSRENRTLWSTTFSAMYVSDSISPIRFDWGK